MILTGKEIQKQVGHGAIQITPFDPRNIGPCSYDLTLGNKAFCFREDGHRGMGAGGPFDICKGNMPLPETEEPIEFEEIVVQPRRLALMHTEESFGSEEFVPILDGRSSLGRLGIFVHITAGYGDLGFFGKWTLEIYSIYPVILRRGMRIAQVRFQSVQGDRSIQYTTGKYNHQDGPALSRVNSAVRHKK